MGRQEALQERRRPPGALDRTGEGQIASPGRYAAGFPRV